MLTRLIELQSISNAGPTLPAAPHNAGHWVPENLDEDGVQMLIGAVRELKTVSQHIFVLRDILNPALLAPLPSELIAQWREVAERIARDGDAHLLDLNDGTVTPADFGDRTHLHPLAAERFSSSLAMRLRPMVEQNRASR
jgi:hypothetical protein